MPNLTVATVSYNNWDSEVPHRLVQVIGDKKHACEFLLVNRASLLAVQKRLAAKVYAYCPREYSSLDPEEGHLG